MKKHIKYFLFCLLSASTIGGCVACGGKGNVADGYTGFLEGHMQSVQIGEPILLGEYVDFIDGAAYTLIAKRGSTEIDLSSRVSWDTTTLGQDGEWELVYTILDGDYKGTYKTTIDFYAPDISFAFTAGSLDSVIIESGVYY